jgi:putative transposase
MKRSRFSEEQVISILKEQEAGSATADVCRRHGISSATFYKWKAKFGGLEISDARRLRALEEENVRLKPPAGRRDARQRHSERRGRKKMVTPDVKRAAVAHACAVHGVSQRRACAALAVDRSTARYVTRRGDDAELRAAIGQVAGERRRFGYRRIEVMLARRGITMNQKKLRRLYGEEKLQVRRRGGRKRALGTRRPIELPAAANQRWSLDFVSDAFTDGRRFRVLAVVDDFTRECLTLVPDTSISGLRVARELDAIIAVRGEPRTCVSDNGTELTSMAILAWTQERRVDWHYIAPGKPTRD